MIRKFILALFITVLSACQMSQTTQTPTNNDKPTSGIINPLPNTIDLNNISDCTLAISFKAEDVAVINDTMTITAKIYTYDLYDMVDISLLKEGDTIIIRDEEVLITSLENSDYGTLMINGGLDLNGYELSTDNETVWYEVKYNGHKAYYEIGSKELTLSNNFELIDSIDLDNDPVTYDQNILINNEDIIYHFVPNNTKAIIENGLLTKIYRSYMP